MAKERAKKALKDIIMLAVEAVEIDRVLREEDTDGKRQG